MRMPHDTIAADGSDLSIGDLRGELARQPHVVVVAERDQLAARREDPGVTPTGEAGLAVVGDDQHWAHAGPGARG